MSCHLCHKATSKSVFYVCDSGHILSRSCSINGSHGTISNDGECSKCKRRKENREMPKLTSHKRDLAVGDFTKTFDKGTVNKGKEFVKNESKDFFTVTYKNVNYNASGSDTSIGNSENLHELLQKQGLPQRPLACPVCSKIIAVDSTFHHFFFDHSKVSRYNLKYNKTQQILFKLSDFDETIKCLGVIIFNDKKGPQTFPLLLIAAKVTLSARNPRNAIDKDSKNNNRDIKVNSLSSLKEDELSNYKAADNTDGEPVKQIVYLLVWLCKTIETEIIYKLTLSREDRRLSFSYTGDALNIKNSQNSMELFQKSECLSIREAAVKNMLNQQGQILISVKIMQDNKLLLQ